MLKDILKRIPGFRTGHKWKMVLAVIIYLFMIILIINLKGASLMDRFVLILQYIIMFGIPFVLITNLGNIRYKLPIFNKGRVIFNIIGIFTTLVIIVTSFSMVDTLKSPEQKQLDSITAQKAEAKADAKKVASALNDKIVALGDVDTLTYDKAADVILIRRVYEALTSEQKGLVTELSSLEKAETRITDIVAEVASALNGKIVALGNVDTLTYDSADDVTLIRKEYEALTPEQKGLVTELASLESAEKRINDIIVAEVASALNGKIVALGNVDTLTYDSADDIILIRKEYEALTPEQKGLVTELASLESAEKKINDIITEIAAAIDDKIAALGDVNTLKYDKADAVVSIRKEYAALTPEEKELVTNLVLLESAEKRIMDLQAIADKAAAEKAAVEKAAADKKAAVEKAAADKKAAAEKAAADKVAAAAKAAEDYENWISSQFSAWDGSNIYLVKLVKENLNDPHSFEHVETVYWNKGTYILVKMTYRANNAFGALILQNVTAKADYVSQTISVISQND